MWGDGRCEHAVQRGSVMGRPSSAVPAQASYLSWIASHRGTCDCVQAGADHGVCNVPGLCRTAFLSTPGCRT